MNYYKKDNKVYGYNDLQIKQGLAKDKTAMTQKEIKLHMNPLKTPEQLNSEQVQEAKQYLQETGWIWEKYNRNVLVLKDATSEDFAIKYADIIAKQEECRVLINELEADVTKTAEDFVLEQTKE